MRSNNFDKELVVMKHTPIPQNFVYPEIKETDYIFGSGQLSGEILRPDGDWRDYLPPEEHQRQHGVESSSCFIEAQQHTLATIQEEQFDIKDQNYSARFNLIFSDATEKGGDPLKGAQTFRDYGLIPDEMLSFIKDIRSWIEFCSFKGGSKKECIKEGKEWLKEWDARYDVVFKKYDPVKFKYSRIKEALKYSPLPVSVVAWYEQDGVYVKPDEMHDNHLVELVYVDEEGYPYIFDTYSPFIKKLDKFYNFDFGMRLSISRKPPQMKVNWVIDLVYNLFAFVKDIVLKLIMKIR